jgi:ribosomal protein L16 Arg81 hydroxylase
MNVANPALNSSAARHLATRLIETLRSTDFFEQTWEKGRLHLPTIYAPEEVPSIFPVERFDDVLTSGSLAAPHLDLVRSGKKSPAPFRISPSPGTDVSKVLADLAAGATVRVAHIEHYMPTVADFTRELEAAFHMPIRANLYLTPPFSQGFQPHFDLDDIFVLQVFGNKTWQLHASYTNETPLPNADLKFEAVRHRPTAAPTEVRLDTGAVLYLPRGAMHEARTDEQASIHITFALIGLKVGDFLQQLVRQLALTEPALRSTIAFDPAKGPDQNQIEVLSATLNGYLQRAAAAEPIAQVAGTMRQTMADHRNPNLRGKLLRGLEKGFSKDPSEGAF